MVRAGLIQTSPFVACMFGTAVVFLLVWAFGDDMTALEREARLETILWAALFGTGAGYILHRTMNKIWKWRTALPSSGVEALRATGRSILFSALAVAAYAMYVFHYASAFNLGYAIAIIGVVSASVVAHLSYGAYVDKREKDSEIETDDAGGPGGPSPRIG